MLRLLLLTLGAGPHLDAGPVCGDRPCVPPEQCITVSGMRRESTHSACWIPCANDGPCPTGMHCTMKYDGPGHVCVNDDPPAPAAAKDCGDLGPADRAPLLNWIRERAKQVACDRAGDASALVLRVTFSDGTEYAYHSLAALEATVQNLRVGSRSLTTKEALDLLKDAEKDAYGPTGCGIRWKTPTQQGDNTEYSGDVCNCQATLRKKGAAVVELTLSGAC